MGVPIESEFTTNGAPANTALNSTEEFAASWSVLGDIARGANDPEFGHEANSERSMKELGAVTSNEV